MQRLPLILFILLAAWKNGYAQNYIFNRLSVGDGLLSNNISAVWQDPAGYLWIGSQSGLQRYDGAVMRTILYDRIDQIVSDHTGRVWIKSGTRIGVFDTNTFSVSFVPYDKEAEVVKPTRIWLRKDGGGKVFLVLTAINCQYFDDTRKRFSKDSSPFDVPEFLKITDVVEDRQQNRYWILASNGFGYWDKKTKSYYSPVTNTQKDPVLSDPETPSVVSRMHIDKENRLWMVGISRTTSRFLCYEVNKARYTDDLDRLSIANNGYFDVYGFGTFEDSLTVAYGLNCFRISHGRTFSDLRSPVNNPYGIHFNSISAILEDREGMLWVATDNGLFYTPGNRYKYVHVLLSQEKQRGTISSILEDKQHHLWMGTWGRGTFMMRNSSDGPQMLPVNELNRLGSAARFVWSLCADDAQNLWVGCDAGRLARYDFRTGKAALYHPAAFGSSAVRQIVKDSEGNLWAGLENGDVYTFNPTGRFHEKILHKAFSLQGAVSKMVRVGSDQLWVAVNDKGIDVIDTKTRKIVRSIDSRSAGSNYIAGIKDILPVGEDLCFIAGEKLGTIHTKSFHVNFDFKHSGQLPGPLFTLQKDRNHNIWIGSGAGIFKLYAKSGVLTRYSQHDGLITIHNNSYVPERSIIMADGRLVFGGNQHLVVFNPEEYNTTPGPPDVLITGFQLNGRYLPADSLAGLEILTLPYAHNTFDIDFATISFAQKGRITYEYKMEGLDTEWITLTSLPRVKYSFLPHGRYRFMVRAKNERGEYSASVTALQLKIRPPFWKTIWFYALLLSVTAALLFYLHRLQLQKLLHIEKVRNRLARDLHDDMGSTLSTINILSTMALQQTSIDEEKSKLYLDTISRSTHQMMEAMDDIVWSINPVNDNIGRILARMKETAGTVLEPRHIDYRFEVESSIPDLHLPMEQKREIFLIFKEALNNIVKYADCTRVVFTLSRKGSSLLMTIRDNGVGFQDTESGSVVRGNGLKNMQSRAAGVKGELSVTSERGKGTLVNFSIPIA